VIIIAGWNSDRRGDRLRDAFALALVNAAALLLLGVASTPAQVVVGYLVFSATFFTGGALLVSSWADVLHVRQVAVGSAAINTLWQLRPWSPCTCGHTSCPSAANARQRWNSRSRFRCNARQV